ncbi:MAG: hypothetical protein ABFS34_12560 [Gemmatimonadota bacterium]
MRRISLFACLTIIVPTHGWAQSTGHDEAPYAVLSEAEEIALARSAAPADVSADADIWVVKSGRYELARRGSNGNACLVGRNAALTDAFLEDSKRHLAPICYDAEGARTVLQMEQRKLQLRLQGRTRDEVRATIAEELASGELPTPKRPAMSYMLSSGQQLYHSGNFAGNWKPHLMIYVPGLTEADIGFQDRSYRDIQVQNEGQPNAILVVVMADFIDP